MEAIALEMSNRCLSAEELKEIVQKLSQKGKFKNEKVPWIELLKVLVNKLSEGSSDLLLQNILKLIKSQNHLPLKDGLVHKKEARVLLEALSDLVTHIHHGLEDSDASVSDISRITAAIMPVVIDVKVQLVRKEKSAAAEVIYNKLSSLLGHSPELLVDALLHCKTLIYSKMREPEIFVPIITHVFSSLKASPHILSSEQYLKYLVLAKFLLFMTSREDLSRTRANVVGLLKVPSSFSEWISQNQIEWLQLDQLDTKAVLKSIIISTVLQTLYSKKGRAVSPEKKKTEAEGRSTLFLSELKTAIDSENGTESRVENVGTTCGRSEMDSSVSDIPAFENSKKHKRKICEDTSEMSSHTKKKKKKSKAKNTLTADSGVGKTEGNEQRKGEKVPEIISESHMELPDMQSSKDVGNKNLDEIVKTLDFGGAHETKYKLGNMEHSKDADCDVEKHKKKKKKKKKKKSIIGDATEGSKFDSESETLKIEVIKENSELINIDVRESVKKTKRKVVDTLLPVDTSSKANVSGQKKNISEGDADCKLSFSETGEDSSIEKKKADTQITSESVWSSEEAGAKKKRKKKKRKTCSDGSAEHVVIEDKMEKNVSLQNLEMLSSQTECKKKKKKLSQDVLESLPLKRSRTESEQHSLEEREDSSETQLAVKSGTVGGETKSQINKKNKKKKRKEKNSKTSVQSKTPEKMMQKKDGKAEVSSESMWEESVKADNKCMQNRKEEIREKEFPKYDLHIGDHAEVGGNARVISGNGIPGENSWEYQGEGEKNEETNISKKSSAHEGKRTDWQKSHKNVCNVECEAKLDQNSELKKKKKLMNLVRKTKINKKQFLRKMLDVVLGDSEGDAALKKSILVKLCDEVNDKKGMKKSKKVKDMNVVKLKESKKKQKSKLSVETLYEKSELAKKKKSYTSIENLRENSEEQKRRKRACSLNFCITDLEPEKYRRDVCKAGNTAFDEPSSSNFESKQIQRDVHSTYDEVSFTDRSKVGGEGKVNVEPSGNTFGIDSENTEVLVSTECNDDMKEACLVDKDTFSTFSSQYNVRLENREELMAANFKFDNKSVDVDQDIRSSTSLDNKKVVSDDVMDRSTTEDGHEEVRDDSSGVDIVYVGEFDNTAFEKDVSDSERDEASGSDGDIVPCDELNKMFTDAETKAYHQKVLEEGMKWKVQDTVMENKILISGEDHISTVEVNSYDERKENCCVKENKGLKPVRKEDSKLEDSDTNSNDSDIDVILETIVRDTGRKSSVAGLKERSRTNSSNDNTVDGVTSLTVSNGVGGESVGTNDYSIFSVENKENAGKAETEYLNRQELPAIEESCGLSVNKDEMKGLPVTDTLAEPANDVTPKLNGKCEGASTFSKDATDSGSRDSLEKFAKVRSEANKYNESEDMKESSSTNMVFLTEYGEYERNRISEETNTENNVCGQQNLETSHLSTLSENVVEHPYVDSCSRSPSQHSDESVSIVSNGSDGNRISHKDSLLAKKSEQSSDMEANIHTVSQQSSKSCSSFGSFLSAIEELNSSLLTVETKNSRDSPMKLGIEVDDHSANEATNVLNTLLSSKLNGTDSDASKNSSYLEIKNSEMKCIEEPVMGKLLSDESPVSVGTAVRKAKAGDESFEVLSNEGDEAYEASSDASEEPLPVSRKRTRSQRKLAQLSRFSEEVSDSDFSPVRRSLRSRRASEVRKKNIYAKTEEKLTNNNNVVPDAKSGLASDSDDTRGTCNRSESSVARPAASEEGQASLQMLALNLEKDTRVEKKDAEGNTCDVQLSESYGMSSCAVTTDKLKKQCLSDSEVGKSKLSKKQAIDCIAGDKSSPVFLMSSRAGMGSQSSPEFVVDDDNDNDGKSLHALESLASMHREFETKKIHLKSDLNKTGVNPDVGEVLVDCFSVSETNECCEERFSKIEGNTENMNEEEGDEIEVLSSGLDEDEELSYNLCVANSVKPDDCWDIGKGLTSSVRSKRLRKRSLHLSTNGQSAGEKKEEFCDAEIPQLKAQCVSEAVLTKEILISPEVSDEECELVSPEEDASRKRLLEPTNIIETRGRISKVGMSPFSTRGSRSGIRSPQKLIPEEQDESSPCRLKHSNVTKGHPGPKSSKSSRRSSSSERGTVARQSSSNCPRSLYSKRSDSSKVIPYNGDAIQSVNISPKKSAFSKCISKEEKSGKPKHNSSASETDHDEPLKITESTLDKRGNTPRLLRSGSGKSNPDIGVKLSDSMSASGESLEPKTGECDELTIADVCSVLEKMNQEESVISDSHDEKQCSVESSDSTSDGKSNDVSIRNQPTLSNPVRRTTRLSLAKVAAEGNLQSKALSPRKQTRLQESLNSESPISPRKSEELESQENALLPSSEESTEEENKSPSSHARLRRQLDTSSSTPRKLQMGNQESASPSPIDTVIAKEKASPSRGRPKQYGDTSPAKEKASPSRGRPKKYGDTSPLTPRKSQTGNQGSGSPSASEKLSAKEKASPSCGRPKRYGDTSPSTPRRSQTGNQESSSPSAVVDSSVKGKSSPSLGKPTKYENTSPLTPRKTRMQGNQVPSTPINTQRREQVSSVLEIKKDISPSTHSAKEPGSKKSCSPAISPKGTHHEPKAASVSGDDSARLSRSRSASASPCKTTPLKVADNFVLKLDKVQSANSKSEYEKDSAGSDDSHTSPSIPHAARVSTRGKAVIVHTSPSPKRLVKEVNLASSSPASQTKKTDRRSTARSQQAPTSLQESDEDEVFVSTRRLRRREVTYTTKR